MKSKLQFSIFILFMSLFTYAQETTINLSMGEGYANQVYYKLSTETETEFLANSWDIAFLRTSPYNQGIVVNDAIGISVFEAGSNNEWDSIDITNEADWTQLYNSDTERANGAFMQGSATYGWGEYNSATHLVTGTVVFVLKYADGSYKKFICELYAAGYGIRYASWDATNSVWEADQTAEISNGSNENNTYNYYSLQNNEEVVAEPASTDWDIVFRKFTTDYPYNGTTVKYLVTGVLQADGVEVAETSTDDTSELTFTTDINTIGYDWKSLNYTTFTYDVDADIEYYVKDADENIFKVSFSEFGGSSTGNLVFNYEDVTSTLAIEDVNESVSFGVYPNPVNTDKKINVIFDVNSANQDEYSIEVYNITGKKVYNTVVSNTTGFYNKELDLSSLNSGVYMLRFNTGSITKTKKVIIK